MIPMSLLLENDGLELVHVTEEQKHDLPPRASLNPNR